MRYLYYSLQLFDGAATSIYQVAIAWFPTFQGLNPEKRRTLEDRIEFGINLWAKSAFRLRLMDTHMEKPHSCMIGPFVPHS